VNMKNSLNNSIPLTKVILANPQMLRVNPASLWFLSNYMNKFQIRTIGNNLVLHSHLPPLNSNAYTRFVNNHLISKIAGPSHAQIAITNACPQNCECCYNKTRSGKVMNTETLKKVARDLKRMGVAWMGLTGGEPLLNKDIVEIVESISGDCAVKLFTTGCGLTPKLAADLKDAGLFSVSVSLDHWKEEIHDRGRRYPGAFKDALKAIAIFKNIPGLHVGVSAVLSREMIRNGETGEFLRFLKGLDIHEAWLSEVKPSVEACRDDSLVIAEEDRLKLVKMQDDYNQEGRMTVNYLGHFEGKECFGCNAGHKMVYIDAFGEVSPCVFTPMSFGNVKNHSIEEIFRDMTRYFPSEESCFINKNYRLLQKYSDNHKILSREETLKMLEEVHFGPLSRFNYLNKAPLNPTTSISLEKIKPTIGAAA
jgi:MoaA/NifB/PqqE/SkfB family radical SAM enzyme